MRIFNLSGQNETIRNFKVISSRDGNVIFGERRKRRKKGKIIFFFSRTADYYFYFFEIIKNN